MPKYMTEIHEGAMIAEYYESDIPHDVIFLGDCEVYETYSPCIMWENYGISSYVRGSSQQLIWQSYYILEDTKKETITNMIKDAYSINVPVIYVIPDIDNMTISELIAFIRENPSVLKRPIMVDETKVQCCKGQYYLETWNVRSMSQGKLDIIKQNMVRVNINI